jgi:hypothetical protein
MNCREGEGLVILGAGLVILGAGVISGRNFKIGLVL